MLIQPEPLEEYEEEATTWIALSDLMTGLMAIFLALSIAIIALQENQKDVIMITLGQGLKEALEEQGIQANVDEMTGRIIISTKTAFDFDRAELKTAYKGNLNKVVRIYSKKIFELEPSQLARIDRIMIEGHADNIGDDYHNMDLSSRRANAIMRYIYKDMGNFKYKNQLLQKLTAVGRGANDATGARGVENADDRKVVFQITFKEGSTDTATDEDYEKVKKLIDDKTR